MSISDIDEKERFVVERIRTLDGKIFKGEALEGITSFQRLTVAESVMYSGVLSNRSPDDEEERFLKLRAGGLIYLFYAEGVITRVTGEGYYNTSLDENRVAYRAVGESIADVMNEMYETVKLHYVKESLVTLKLVRTVGRDSLLFAQYKELSEIDREKFDVVFVKRGGMRERFGVSKILDIATKMFENQSWRV